MSAFNLFKKSKSVRPAQDKPTAKRKPAAIVEKPVETKAEPTPVMTEVSPVLNMTSSAILHPYVSEKATRVESMNQYMFKVARTANKPEIKKAIQNRYKVKVVAVNIINTPSKKRTVGRHVGMKAGFRKAIVTLVEGDTINFAKA